MTLRKTTIIEWETTPKELRRIADDFEVAILKMTQKTSVRIYTEIGHTEVHIIADQDKLLAEQAEDKE